MQNNKANPKHHDFRTVADYLDLVEEVLRNVANLYDSEISTVFRVTDDRTKLYLEAIYDQAGKIDMGDSKPAPYQLNWEAKSPKNMLGGGVTAWVAISGEPLFIPNLNILRKHPAYAGKGAWDSILFKDKVEHPDQGFGCLYAVPLYKSGDKGSPKNSVIGVFKIERRKGKEIFKESDRKAFQLAAVSISRTLEMYVSTSNTLRGILSEAAHILRGKLSDSLNVIQMCDKLLHNIDPDIEYAKSNLPKAEKLLNIGNKRIASVIEAYKGPQIKQEFTVGKIVREAQEAGFQDQSNLQIIWEIPEDTSITMHSIQRYDLESILLNLFNNAERHSNPNKPVELTIGRPYNSNNRDVFKFVVTDYGKGIDEKSIAQARDESHSKMDEEVLLMMRPESGTGLIRIYRLAKKHGWTINYKKSKSNGSTFEILIYSLSTKPIIGINQ